MNPRRTTHFTQHLIAPGHLVIVRRLGGRDLWMVEENYLGRVTDLADGARFTDRAGAEVIAEVIAEAYAATRTHHEVGEGAR